VKYVIYYLKNRSIINMSILKNMEGKNIFLFMCDDRMEIKYRDYDPSLVRF